MFPKLPPRAIRGVLLATRARRAGRRMRLGRRQQASTRPARRVASGKGEKIALLLPENKTARYENQDKPFFEAKVKELCPTAR